MAADTLTDAQYALVASVAEREGWSDLSAPPLSGPSARTLAEQHAIVLFRDALAPATPRPRRAMDPRTARMIMVAACVIAVVVCWFVSPGRTAVALLAAGAFCLWTLRRRKRREGMAYPSGVRRSPRMALRPR